MEPDVKKFLAIIVQVLSMTVLWMLIFILVGIKMGWLFLEGDLSVWHGLYYLCMIASFVWLLFYIRKKWKELPRFDVDKPGN